MALNQAKAQIEQLKSQPAAPFLPHATPPPVPSGRSFGGGYQGSSYQAPQPPSPPQYAPAYQYAQDPPPSRFSSFLHNAAQTAAGVVAGEVAFSALSSIFGNRGGGGFFGGGGGGYYGSPISPGSETIINNNYYEGGGDRERDSEDRFAGDSGSQDEALPADDTSTDDTSADDSSFDDGSSYDDGSDSNDV
jgi:hypothetical protein